MALKLPEGNFGERLEGYLSAFDSKHAVDEGTVEKNAVKLVVSPEVVPAVLATAREELGILHFAFLTVVDRVGSFEVNYELLDLRGGIIRIKTVIEGTEPVIGTATKAYPGANWHEREAYDMFGVAFRGHPDLRRTYMWQDHFDHHPLLKELEINTKRTFEGLR